MEGNRGGGGGGHLEVEAVKVLQVVAHAAQIAAVLVHEAKQDLGGDELAELSGLAAEKQKCRRGKGYVAALHKHANVRVFFENILQKRTRGIVHLLCQGTVRRILWSHRSPQL